MVIKKLIYKLYKYLKVSIILENLYFLFQIFPIKNKVMVVNHYGNGYGDNAKYIVEKLLQKNIEVIWVVKNKNIELPMGVKKVKIGTFRYFYEIFTSKIWIDNCRKPYFIKKRSVQYYIQTWHGAPALKRIEKDVEEALSEIYVKNAKQDSKNIDVMISNSKWMTELYRSSFWYQGEILEIGSPRNDIFFEKKLNYREKIDNRYGSKDRMIVLYAPTFRKTLTLKHYNLNYDVLSEIFKKKFNKEVIFFIRLHPNISNKSKEIENKDNVINVSDFEDLQELMYASDILITDYSSLMFDFSLQKKPCFLYADDLEEYKKDRDLYFDIEELPFSFSQTIEEFKDKIQMFDFEKYTEELKKFNLRIGTVEKGDASQKITDLILEKLTKI